MAGLLNLDSIKGLHAVQSLLENAEATERIIRENYGHITDPTARLTATV